MGSSPDDDDDERAALLKSSPNSNYGSSDNTSMSLADKIYAYDLTLATLTYQRWGQNPRGRLLWEALSHTGDGIMYARALHMLLFLLGSVGVHTVATDGAASAGGLVVRRASRQHGAINADDHGLVLHLHVCASFWQHRNGVTRVDLLIIIVLKLIFKRARPPHHQTDGRFVGPDQHSFPSGHATRVGCIVALIFYLSETYPSMVRAFFLVSPAVLCPLIVVWALAIGFSRVALGRHYPSDILAGGLIGMLVIFPAALFVINRVVVIDQLSGALGN